VELPVRPDLDTWLARPQITIAHRRETDIPPDELWAAAQAVQLSDTRRLGRLVRWRIPGLAADLTFDELFRSPPFNVLAASDRLLVAGLVGRIWTLRRDYPVLSDPDEFRAWNRPGTVRVLFANWVEALDGGGAALHSEARVAPVDRWGRMGLRAVRPLIASSHGLISSDGIEAALHRAGDQASARSPTASRWRSRGATR
jgi:hypothetical protein